MHVFKIGMDRYNYVMGMCADWDGYLVLSDIHVL